MPDAQALVLNDVQAHPHSTLQDIVARVAAAQRCAPSAVQDMAQRAILALLWTGELRQSGFDGLGCALYQVCHEEQ